MGTKHKIRVYVGRSPAHQGNVALVLNPSSGHVSPQCHAIFDDDFTLTPALSSNTVPTNWVDLLTKSEESATDLDIDSSKIWFN